MTVEIYMVKIYARLVKAGVRTIASLPEVYQQPVTEYIAKN